MTISRTDIFNFKSDVECEKYISSHKEFMKSLDVKGLQEIHWVRATPESLLIFSIFDSEEVANQAKSKANDGERNSNLIFMTRLYLMVS